MSIKTCSKCGGLGPFPQDKKRNRLASWCYSCYARAAREYYAKHKSERRRYSFEYRQNHPEWRAEYDSKYPKRFPEKAKAKSRRYRKKHAEKIQKRIKKWAVENPEKVQAYGHNHRALKRNAVGTHTGEEWKTLKTNYDNRCAYCNQERVSIEPDHVIPLVRGGSNSIENIVPACKSCNRSKQDTPLLVWMFNKANE